MITHFLAAAHILEKIEMAKKPTVVKKLKGIPIGSYAEVKDAAGKSTIKPKLKRKPLPAQYAAKKKQKWRAAK